MTDFVSLFFFTYLLNVEPDGLLQLADFVDLTKCISSMIRISGLPLRYSLWKAANSLVSSHPH